MPEKVSAPGILTLLAAGLLALTGSMEKATFSAEKAPTVAAARSRASAATPFRPADVGPANSRKEPASSGPAAAHRVEDRASAVPKGPPPPGVAAILDEISSTRLRQLVDRLAKFGTRHTLSDTTSQERGIGAARRWIKAQFEKYAAASGRSGSQQMQVSFDRHQQKPDGRRITHDVEIVNVVATLPGSLPAAKDRLYYVIGHYDSRATDVLDATSDAPGANDDGSGVALVMELARVLSKYRFDSTLVFMATAGEEQGLLGARLHAEAAQKAGLDIRAVLSNDIVGDPSSPSGRRHDHQVRLFSEALPREISPEAYRRLSLLSGVDDTPSRQLARSIQEIADWHRLGVQPRMIYRTDRFLRGGDHTAFNQNGYAAVRFTEVEENYNRQHQDLRTEGDIRYGDLPEHVDSQYLAGVARINGAALVHLARAPSTPTKARIIVAGLDTKTTLRWSPSPEDDVAGYEVVWRDTTSPVWQHVRDAGPATEITLDLSKDNNFFGIRAYDKEGYRSPAAFPVAARQ